MTLAPRLTSTLPPKHPPLGVSESRCLAFLKRRQGQWTITDHVLKAMKESPAIWDNHASVIWAMTRLEDREKIVGGYVTIGGEYRAAWYVPLPAEEDPVTGAKLPVPAPTGADP